MLTLCGLEKKDQENFYKCEKWFNETLNNQPLIMLCAYPIARQAGAAILDVARNHEIVIARRDGDWEMIESP